MRRQVELWLQQALIDLKTAEKLVEDPELTPSTAFHCQQCIEKCLKGLIENRDMSVPKTHNLPHLLGIVSSGYVLHMNEEILNQVNEVYVDSRYPGDAGLVPEGKPYVTKAKAFVAFAQEVYNRTAALLR